MDNDADDLDDDDDVTEDVPEHFADDLDIETKEKEINQVTFLMTVGNLWTVFSNSGMLLTCFYI